MSKYIKVPMGMNFSFIKISQLSDYSLMKLLDSNLTDFEMQAFSKFNIDAKKAKMQAFDVAQRRGLI